MVPVFCGAPITDFERGAWPPSVLPILPGNAASHQLGYRHPRWRRIGVPRNVKHGGKDNAMKDERTEGKNMAHPTWLPALRAASEAASFFSSWDKNFRATERPSLRS